LYPPLKPTKAPEIGGNPTGNEAKKTIHFQRLCWFWGVFFHVFSKRLAFVAPSDSYPSRCHSMQMAYHWLGPQKRHVLKNIRMTIKILVEGGPF